METKFFLKKMSSVAEAPNVLLVFIGLKIKNL